MNLWEILDALLTGAGDQSGGSRTRPATHPTNGPTSSTRPVDSERWEAQFRDEWDRARESSEAVFAKTREEMREQLESSRTELHEALSASQGELTTLRQEVTERLTTIEKSLSTLAVQSEDVKRLERKVNLLLGMAAIALLLGIFLAYRAT